VVEIPSSARQSTHHYGLIKWKMDLELEQQSSVDFHNPDFVKFAVFDQGFVDISRNRSLGFLLLLRNIFHPACKHLNASSSVTSSLLWIMSLRFFLNL
jgi:hypothetical protein